MGKVGSLEVILERLNIALGILIYLTIKNCDKTFRKNIIKRLKNTTFRCTLHHYQVKLKMQDCGYKYKNGQ